MTAAPFSSTNSTRPGARPVRRVQSTAAIAIQHELRRRPPHVPAASRPPLDQSRAWLATKSPCGSRRDLISLSRSKVSAS